MSRRVCPVIWIAVSRLCKPLWVHRVKFFPFIIMCGLLLAACASTSGNEPEGDDFVSGDVASDAAQDNAVKRPRRVLAPLTSDERGDAALMIVELENATDQETRDGVINRIIDLGPRYLQFLRNAQSDEAALDLMYIVRRIESKHDRRPDAPNTPDQSIAASEGETIGNGGEDAPRAPDYDVGDDYDRLEVEKFLGARLRQAQTLLAGGRFDAAIRIAEAAIVLLPDSELRPDFDALILKAKGDSQADLLIAGTLSISPESVQYAAREKGAKFKTPLEINCFLKNVSTEPITLRLFEGEGKESLLELVVTYEQHDYQGNVMSQRGNVGLPIDAGNSIKLVPNESYALTVPLEGLSSLDADAPLKHALGRVEIQASLRIFGASNDDGAPIILKPVSFPTRTVHVFPSRFDLARTEASPLAAIQDALDEGEAQELFLSAHFISKQARRAAGDALFEDYDRSSLAMKRARLKSLSVIFNVGRNWDHKLWQDWWKENRLRQ